MVYLYLIPFFAALGISLSLSLFFSLLPGKYFRGRVGKRHIGNGTLSRLGGVAIIAAFFLVIAFHPALVLTKPIMGMFLAGGLILVFGLFDDFSELDWKTQMLFQFGIAILSYLFLVRIEYITNPFGGGTISFPSSEYFLLSFSVTLFWFLVIMNSVNWLDGADGLLGSVGVIAAGAVFFVSLRPEVNQPPVAILAAALAGSVFGFLLLNAPPARILAGTTGSMFVGFSLATISIFAGSKIATTLLILSFPVLDAAIVLLKRLFSGDSLFQADRRHFHFSLLEAGWTMRRIFIALTGITLLVALFAVSFSTRYKVVAFLSVAVLFFLLFLFQERRKRSKSRSLFFLIVGIVLLSFFFFFGVRNTEKEIRIREHVWSVEVADDPSEPERGLGYRATLAPGTGMLFLFSEAFPYQFWMKGMEFPLDIVWIRNGTVIYIERNISPERTDSFGPSINADSVLEVNGGEAADIHLGDSVEF